MERAGMTCEGCHGSRGNWTCDGDNEDSDHDCGCEYCTGCEACYECGGCGIYDCDCDGQCHEEVCGCGGGEDDQDDGGAGDGLHELTGLGVRG